jgi:hypothetical protein
LLKTIRNIVLILVAAALGGGALYLVINSLGSAILSIDLTGLENEFRSSRGGLPPGVDFSDFSRLEGGFGGERDGTELNIGRGLAGVVGNLVAIAAIIAVVVRLGERVGRRARRSKHSAA